MTTFTIHSVPASAECVLVAPGPCHNEAFHDAVEVRPHRPDLSACYTIAKSVSRRIEQLCEPLLSHPRRWICIEPRLVSQRRNGVIGHGRYLSRIANEPTFKIPGADLRMKLDGES